MNQRQGTGVLVPRGITPRGEVRSIVEQIVSVQESIQAVLAGLTQLASGTDEQVRDFGSRFDELGRAHHRVAEAQQQTEEKLNALIAVVDGLVARRPPPL